MCAWLPAPWHLADRGAVIEDLAEQVDVFRWIDVIMSAPSTATVPIETLARWAAASKPRASPDTTTKPAAPRSRAIRSANFAPAAEALREPNTAIMGCASAAIVPRTAISGGASSIIRSRTG